MKRAIFRVDANATIGTGHLMRCLTLADALKQQGWHTSFACFELPKACQTMVTDKQHAFIELGPKGLGLTDCKAPIVTLLDQQPCDWLIIDHYQLDQAWERSCQEASSFVGRKPASNPKILVIADYLNQSHDCDLLLNQNWPQETHPISRSLVPQRCQILQGPRYALLHPQYAALRQTTKLRHKLETVLIYFGGSDTRAFMKAALQGLADSECAIKQVDMVLPSTLNASQLDALNQSLQAIAAKQAGTSQGWRLKLHHNLPNLAALTASVDLCIGAVGATSWERFCLGAPSLTTIIADNQRDLALSLAQMGVISLIPEQKACEPLAYSQALKELSVNDALERLSRDCMAVCDGQGVNRLVKYMQ